LNQVDLDHVSYKLRGVLAALRRAREPLQLPPPAAFASCIVLGQTTREDVEQVLGTPWRPSADVTGRVAHYVYDRRGARPDALGSLFLEYDDAGVVRAMSASTRSLDTTES
jgi:SmpA/OmlA family protein